MTGPSTEGFTTQGGTELARYLAMARRWWWLLLAGAAIGGLAAFFITRAIPPTYRATATLLINQAQEPGATVYNDVLTSERLTKTYRELITKRPVLEAVAAADEVGDITVGELRSKVDAKVVRDTQLVEVSVTDRDPARAALLADAVADTFVRRESDSGLSRPGATSVVEPAVAPVSSVWPNMRLNVALAVVVGLLLAGGLALLLEHLDDALETPDEVKAQCALPTLCEVARWRSHKEQIRLAERGEDGAEAEAYGVLRTNVQFSTIGNPGRVVLVTSAGAAEGKSTTAANYALAVAYSGKTVALLDSDLRRPSLHRAFRADNAVGLTSALLRNASLDGGALRPTHHPGLFLMTSGPLPPNPAELLDWAGFEAVLERLKEKVDLVVLDSPPVQGVADARILAAKADATILVVDSGKTRAKSVNDARQALSRANANVLGVVLNKVRRSRRSYYYYYAAEDGRAKKRKKRERRPSTSVPLTGPCLTLSTTAQPSVWAETPRRTVSSVPLQGSSQGARKSPSPVPWSRAVIGLLKGSGPSRGRGEEA